MLIDQDMKKKDPGTGTSSVTKMGEGGHVTIEVLAQICIALDCTLDDIMEIVSDSDNKKVIG